MAVSTVGTPVIRMKIVLGETSLEYCSSSTPFISGMQISEITMSKTCAARRRLAAWPLETTSTLWPSLRKLISSSSEMEGSSSTTSKWAMARYPFPTTRRRSSCSRGSCSLGARARDGTRNFDDEVGAGPLLTFDANASAVRLQNLIHDGQAEACAPGESGLEGFEDARGLRRVNADAGVAYLNAHPVIVCRDADGKHAAGGHGAQRVVAKVPEDLLQGVAIGASA